MRVGIMGGTLDPVHNGHILAAKAALSALSLDRVMLLPAGDPPHKNNPTDKLDRLEMTRLAAQEAGDLFCCSMEIFRSGTTYTVDTLTELHRNNPNTEWFYIIGADTLDVLDTWRNFGEVAKLCTFAVLGRAEEDVSRERMREFSETYGARFAVLQLNGPDISSTSIRSMAARGENISEFVPTSVCNYIKDRGLYLSSLSRKEILGKLEQNLKESRFIHTLGVAETARRLSERFGVAPGRAELAALLHDCAKYMPADDLRDIVARNVPDADEDELQTQSVLHAPAGAVLAEREYGVQDAGILSAIRKHTLGGREMSALDALIYTADFIEPNRKSFPGLADARKLAETDIFAAAAICAELTNAHLISQGGRPHSRSLAMLETIKNKQEEIK